MTNKYDDEIDYALVEEFQDVIVEVFKVLQLFGIEELHVGGIMRILGVSPEVAEQYDDQMLAIDKLNNHHDFDFSKIPLSSIVNNPSNKKH